MSSTTDVAARELSQVQGALSPEDLFKLRFLRGAQLSPDGTEVAYCISDTGHSKERTTVNIARLDGARTETLLFDNASSPRWSPMGDAIAFNAGGRLYVADYPSLKVSKPLTPAHLMVVGSPAWSPNGRHLAVSLASKTAPLGGHKLSGKLFRADGIGFVDSFRQTIHVIGRDGSECRELKAKARFCSQPDWSSTGEYLLFLECDAAVPYADYSQRLICAKVETGRISEVLGGGWYIESARWIPETESIVLAGARNSPLTLPLTSVWVVHRSGQDVSLRTPGLTGTLGCRINHDMPARELMGGGSIVPISQSSALATIQSRGVTEIFQVSLQGEISSHRLVTGDRSCVALDVNRSSDAFLFAQTDLHSPLRLCLGSLGPPLGERHIVTFNDDVLAHWPRHTVTPVEFKSFDGIPIDAWFLAPAGVRRPLPTILSIHNGPFAAAGHAYRYDFHMLTASGYGVVFANFRGSSGYGESFVRAIMGDWGARAFPDHIGAVDAAVAAGLADEHRIGVWGQSHGGFATCWLVGHTHRFKAAIAEAAFTNFTSLYYLSDAPAVWARDLGGLPHEIPDVYRARSPITYAHRCRTPTLLVHGEDDLRCPIEQAEQFHRALIDSGCSCELWRIAGAGHLGDSIGPLSARQLQNEALLTWFRHHL